MQDTEAKPDPKDLVYSWERGEWVEREEAEQELTYDEMLDIHFDFRTPIYVD